mgnify:CR=1 FL=1
MEEEQSEAPTCSSCMAEPCSEDYLNEGWTESEFGLVCPECFVVDTPVGDATGIEAIAAALEAKKQEDVK